MNSEPYGVRAVDDPAAYEHDCLVAVREELAALAQDPVDASTPNLVSDIRLLGSYPETCLVVDVRRGGSDYTLTWHLWGDDFGTTAEGYRDWPQSVAQQVLIQVYEV